MGKPIKDGETTIEDALGPVPDRNKRVRHTELNDKLTQAVRGARRGWVGKDEGFGATEIQRRRRYWR